MRQFCKRRRRRLTVALFQYPGTGNEQHKAYEEGVCCLCYDVTLKFSVNKMEKQDTLPTMYWLSKLHLNKANVSDAEASFLDLHLSISDDFVTTKIYDKRDDFDFDIVNFLF